jgi:sugar phosphate isomerase/epimerase
MTQIDRRSFLVSLGGAALVAAGCTSRQALAVDAAQAGRARIPGKRKLERIGIQMYTVRTQARADLRDTLTRLSQLGYKEVEWWGTYPLTAVEIRGLLDEKGLAAPSVHIGIPREQAGWTPIFESARALGHRWITAASPPFQARTTDDWKRLAGAFNESGKRVRDAGYRFAFHNHSEGMRVVDGKRPFEIVLAETDPELVWFELDVHWAYAGGADALDLITRYPTRFRMMHIKDSAGAPDFKQADVGQGTYPWPQLLAAADKAGVEHYFVEHDSPADAMIFAKTSFEYLAGLEF